MRDSKTIDSSQEAMLLDLLYGDLEGDALATAEKQLESADLLDDLEDYRGLRSLYATLEEEEPAGRISSQLMAAAAEEASKRTSGGWAGWLERLYKPLLAHPGIVAFASLALVVGVYGSLVVTGGASQPEISSESPIAVGPEEEEQPMDDFREKEGESAPGGVLGGTIGSGSGDTGGLDEIAQGFKDEESAPPRESKPAPAKDNKLERKTRSTKPKKTSAPSKKPAPPPKPIVTSKSRGKMGNRSNLSDSFADDVDGEFAASPDSNVGGSTSGGSYRPQQRKRVDGPQAPAPASEPAPAQQEKRDVAEPSAEIQRLYNQAITAAKKDDCAAVQKLGARVRQLDSRFYDSQFLSNRTIRGCMAQRSAPSK